MPERRTPTGLQRAVHAARSADVKAIPVTIGLLIVLGSAAIGLLSLMRQLTADVTGIVTREVRVHNRDWESHPHIQRKFDAIQKDLQEIRSQQNEIQQKQRTMFELIERQTQQRRRRR